MSYIDKKEKTIQIYELIKNGDIEQVKKLFITDSSMLDFITPFGMWLHVAARAGKLDMMKFLVESGMNVNLNEGIPKSAPIAHAASEGYLEIVEYLFSKGAKLDVSAPHS